MNYIKSLFNIIQKRPYLIFLAIVTIGAIFSTTLTSRQDALQFDASSYYISANEFVLQKLDFIELFSKPSFIDLGYPLALSFMIRVFGNNIKIFQVFNFLCWFLATVFIYKALKLITDTKKTFLGSLVMACSPIYLTFSAKLYSEPFAALGLSMIIYFLIKYKLKEYFYNLLGILFGMLIFFFTKSVYILLVIPILCFCLTRRYNYKYLILILFACLIIIRLFYSIQGGRSDYNLAIQSSKIHQSYGVIGACSVYYLSYPLGKVVFPKLEGACRQNDPQTFMPGYTQNPYILAENIRDHFNIGSWLQIILSNPIKYLVVLLSNMTSIIFVEGVYANVTEHYNSVSAMILFGSIKIFFAFYIWSSLVKNFRTFLKYNLKTALLSVIPLLYFFLIVGNYPVEQRYFFPLMPWIYFYAALNIKGIGKITDIFLRSNNS